MDNADPDEETSAMYCQDSDYQGSECNLCISRRYVELHVRITLSSASSSTTVSHDLSRKTYGGSPARLLMLELPGWESRLRQQLGILFEHPLPHRIFSMAPATTRDSRTTSFEWQERLAGNLRFLLTFLLASPEHDFLSLILRFSFHG